MRCFLFCNQSKCMHKFVAPHIVEASISFFIFLFRCIMSIFIKDGIVDMFYFYRRICLRVPPCSLISSNFTVTWHTRRNVSEILWIYLDFRVEIWSIQLLCKVCFSVSCSVCKSHLFNIGAFLVARSLCYFPF